MTLKFSPGNHQYWLDKKRCPGVTTIIKGGVPSPALMYWSARTVAEFVADNPRKVEAMYELNRGQMVAALKEVPWEKRDSAAIRGTEVHDLAERIVQGIEVDVPEYLEGHVDGYVRWLDTWHLVPVLTEKSCANRTHWYAGRFDLIGDIAGVRWMLDVKTASNIYGENALQTDAYRNAEFYVDDGEPDVELPMPEGIERLGALHVTADGTELVELCSTGEAFEDFLHAKWTHTRKRQREGYVGAVLTTGTLDVAS